MTDIEMGITGAEAQKRLEAGLGNVQVRNQSKSVGQIIAGNIFTYFNLIFAVFAVLLIVVRSYINMTFLPIIVCNTLIGIVQEIRAKRVLDRLNVMNASKTLTVRDGEAKEIDSEHLVKGDLCIFEAGNQICADALIVNGSVRVNESLITGEADEVIKKGGDMLYSGSFVVSGKCSAVLENVGLDSFAAKLMLEAKSSRKKQQTEMMRSLDKLVSVIGVAIIPIGIFLYLQQRFALGLTMQESVVAVIASLVGMIPEGLYLLASIALVVSVMRLGRRKVLVHEMACVETLARVNVLCVDKTGTITENKMSVQEIVPIEETDRESLHALIGDVVDNLDSDNITMKALKEYFDCGEYRTALRTFPFSSETKYSGAEFDDGIYLLGAPEMVLLDNYHKYASDITKRINDGVRVLVFGRYPVEKCGREDISENKPFLKGGELMCPIEPMAYILISNPVRNEAKATFEYFEKQGVTVKVISGDHPKAASNVAKKAGIAQAGRYIDVSGMDKEALKSAAGQYTVFGRVSPEQKKILVEAIKDAGNVVAMTGDGVNDVLALKASDCSIAMASGSEAASNAAQIVLLNSDFSQMPSVVLEGRRVVNNIERSASLFLVKNLFSIFMTVFTLIAVNKYPLYPTQLSLLGAFTIGMPAFLLAMQPNKSLIQGHFLTNVVIKALPAALTDFIGVALLMTAGSAVGVPHEKLSTMCLMVMLSVGIAALIKICMPFDRIRAAICVLMIAGIVFSVAFLKPVFAIYELPPTQWIMTAALMAIVLPLYKYMCISVSALIDEYAKRSENFRRKLK